MAMNVKPIATLDERINDIRMRTAEIVNRDIIPNENRLWRARREGESFAERTEVLELRAPAAAFTGDDLCEGGLSLPAGHRSFLAGRCAMTPLQRAASRHL